MTIAVNTKAILKMAPTIHVIYKDGLADIQTILDRHGITENKKRLCHFLAQIFHETGNLSKVEEGLSYSADRLPAVWPTRFKPKGPLDPAQYARNPEKLANEVYGGRNGNTAPGDGYLYRGRGPIQTTGKFNYQKVTDIVRKFYPTCPNFVTNPELVNTAKWCFIVAAANWEANNCNSAADADDITLVSKRVNGGTVGLDDRKKKYKAFTEVMV